MTKPQKNKKGFPQQELIKTGVAISAKYGRLGKAKVYDFKQERHNKYFEKKKIEVFYAIENNKIATITVYVFYGGSVKSSMKKRMKE